MNYQKITLKIIENKKMKKKEELLRKKEAADQRVRELDLNATLRIGVLSRRILNCDDEVKMPSMSDQCREHRNQHRMRRDHGGDRWPLRKLDGLHVHRAGRALL